LPLEASGNIDADNIVATANTGVDYISIGGMTKNIQAIDLSLRFS
ncbi:MAG TPA: nicotinate-nucleotide diphosphorylase, partial [Gammaproteobacteria bacterium]|nr:nicotinate-nucleotide diphosphorylase [Gammaproteobacteria bacterium]